MNLLKKLLFLLFIACLIALSICLGVKFLKINAKIKVQEKNYSDNTLKTNNPYETLGIDIAQLYKQNSDFACYLIFPKGTPLEGTSYPVVKAKKDSDDNFYLHHSFDKSKNINGSIFIASFEKGKLDGDNINDNTIIYGHNMNDGAMFGTLDELTKQDVYNQDSFFYIITPTKHIYRYDIFSVENTKDMSECYKYQFKNKNYIQKFINEHKANSIVDTINVDTNNYSNNHLITLSTCDNKTNNGRYVIHAIRTKEIEATEFNALFK